MKNALIKMDDKIELDQILCADDMLISGGDIAFGGVAIGEGFSTIKGFAAHLASLAHIVNRIVLSNRIVFLDDPNGGGIEPPSCYLQPLIKKHCKTLAIDENHPSIRTIAEEAFTTPNEVFGSVFLQSMREKVGLYGKRQRFSLIAFSRC